MKGGMGDAGCLTAMAALHFAMDWDLEMSQKAPCPSIAPEWLAPAVEDDVRRQSPCTKCGHLEHP